MTLADHFCDLCSRQLASGHAHAEPVQPARDGIRLPVVLGALWWLAVIGLVVAAGWVVS